MKNQKAKLFHRDKENIARFKQEIDNRKLLYDNIVSAFNSIIGIPKMTNEQFQELFFAGVEPLAEQVTLTYYDHHFKAAHQGLGISTEKGLKMAEDNLPDLSPIAMAYEAWLGAARDHNGSLVHFPTYQMFKIEGEIVVKDNDAINEYIEKNYSVFLTDELEIQYIDAISNFLKAIKTVNSVGEKIHPKYMAVDTTGMIRGRLEIGKLLAPFMKSRYDQNIILENAAISHDFVQQLKADVAYKRS